MGRRARALPPGWNRLRALTFERDDYQCVQCGSRRMLECDHIVAREDGGTDHLTNLRTLCRGCHIERTAIANGAPPTMPEQREWAKFAKRRAKRAWH